VSASRTRVRVVSVIVSGALVAVAATLGVGTATAAGPPAAASPTGAAADRSKQGPVQAARAAGHRVEVVEQRSETHEVYANPDGSFTAELHTTPVRVRRGSGWVAVDTTLKAVADGMVSPAATAASLALSGGGSAPLVRIGSGDRQVELRWPEPLPKPVLAGDTATYPEVLPGVDLRLRATADGFSEELVVKTPAAARSPKLARLRFGLATKGVTLGARGSGGLRAKDKAGNAVFQSGPPQLWDAPAPPTMASSSQDEPAIGAHQAVGQVELAAGQLTIVPDEKLLADPATVFPVSVSTDFPVSINADTAPGQVGWAKVFSGKPGTSYWNGGGDVECCGPFAGQNLAKSGQCWNAEGACNGIGLAHSFFQYGAGFLAGKHILNAEFNVLEVWAPSCSARALEAWGTNPVNPGTTWGNQPFPGGGPASLGAVNVAMGYSGSCPAGWIGFDATRAVNNALTFNGGTTTIMLKASNEADQSAWKKFNPNATLIVRYNSYPNVPTGMTANNKPCAYEPNEPYIDDPSPTLRAAVSDPDGGLVRAQFQWWVRHGAKVGEATTSEQSSGSTFIATIPDGKFTDGSKIAYRVRGYDGIDPNLNDPNQAEVGWSQWCDVTVDQTPPDKPPTVTSATYLENDLGGGIGRTGGFTFTANGVADVAGFVYDLHDQPQTFVRANAPGGSATAPITPPDDGPMDLFVRSQDRAGNLGPVKVYHFLVGAGTPPVGHWDLDGWSSITSAPDGSGRGHDGTVSGIWPATGAAWDVGRVSHALRLDGASGQVTTSGGQAVNTANTYAVAAWVKLGAADGQWRAAVSQDGTSSSGFALEYRPDGRWMFVISPADSTNPLWIAANSATPAQAGVWTHLVGVYDQGTREVRLYVNGALSATTPIPANTTVNNVSGGGVVIGRAKQGSSGGNCCWWLGSVDDVRVYDRALSTEEIHDLATTPAVEEEFLPLDEGAGTTAADVSGSYRHATLSGGASWAPGRVGAGAVQFDGSGALATAGPVVRTDSSFTVTALVMPDVLDGAARTAVSQDGNRAGGFYLQYRGDTGRWTFMLVDSDNDNPHGVRAEAPETPEAGEWTHLAGVYDAAAREIRLYINGALAARAPSTATRWNATGPLVVGRARYNGVATDFWKGAVDDVHVWTGVRTGDQIRDEFLNPVTRRVTVYTGQLTRWVSHDGHHLITTAGVAPAGYHFEGPLGLPAPTGAADTRMLYECEYSGGQFISTNLDECTSTGRRLLRPLGLVYVNQPTDVPALPVYRCLVANSGDHFVSYDANCEGQTFEFRLGYTRAYAYLVRYLKRDVPADHRTTMRQPGPGYSPEGNFGVVALTSQAGTATLRDCTDGADAFTSTDAACEGKTVVSTTGRIWSAPPQGVGAYAELLRCTTTSGGERFDSTDPGCEGNNLDRSLGYVVTQL
jgi:hypothetical protein